MKGLDPEELEIIRAPSPGVGACSLGCNGSRGRSSASSSVGWSPRSTVSCGAYDCVGHQALTMTSVGVMVWNAVKCGG